jgi:hypothetical protein
MWFEKLVGFKENTMNEVRSKLEVRNKRLSSLVNGREFIFGELEIPTLFSLQQRLKLDNYRNKIHVEEKIGNIQSIHLDPENNGAVFQVASQFNLLEMVGPHVSPERGVGIYENDFTQGPACAISCGAGTIYRNYFVNINGEIGQSRDNQIDCLSELGAKLNNLTMDFWSMQNGYALSTKDALIRLSEILNSKTKQEYDELKGLLKVGIQWNTQVTLNDSNNLVSQVYCSALPVAYSGIDPIYWEPFARLILEATYEATLYTALINYERTGNPKIYLTLIGGGAFGNSSAWIFDAIRQAIDKFRNTPLEVKIVSYNRSNQTVINLSEYFK